MTILERLSIYIYHGTKFVRWCACAKYIIPGMLSWHRAIANEGRHNIMCTEYGAMI